MRSICAQRNKKKTRDKNDNTGRLSNRGSSNQSNQINNCSKKQQQTEECLLRSSLLLTEDNKLWPACLALSVWHSVCQHVCVCTIAHSTPQSISGSATHGPSSSRLSPKSSRMQSDCLSRVSGLPKQARKLSQARLTVTSSYLLLHSVVYLSAYLPPDTPISGLRELNLPQQAAKM